MLVRLDRVPSGVAASGGPQEVVIPQMRHDGVPRAFSGIVGHPERPGDGLFDVRRSRSDGQVGQLGPRHAAGEHPLELMGHAQRQPRLSDTAHAYERHQAGGADDRADLLDEPHTANELCYLGRDAVSAIERSHT
jgi:hypothetical protein